MSAQQTTMLAPTIMFVAMIILLSLLEAVLFAGTKMVEATPMFATAMMFALLWKTAVFDAADRWGSLAVKVAMTILGGGGNGSPRQRWQ